ncbi:ZrgA family zinc uptake protein, partial [Vibrio sonorensis]|uniref:ZrgA family zinc uptake protein n=1 Tax=Vibrio sonorensis TaxID=1004316 RepID=UPI000A54F4A5
DKHDHDHDHHDHDKHDKHDHSGHGEFTVEYHYECEQFSQLNELEVNWFEQFKNTQSIGANVLTDKTQTAVKLSADKTKISL